MVGLVAVGIGVPMHCWMFPVGYPYFGNCFGGNSVGVAGWHRQSFPVVAAFVLYFGYFVSFDRVAFLNRPDSFAIRRLFCTSCSFRFVPAIPR